jgi:hypothetical protein
MSTCTLNRNINKERKSTETWRAKYKKKSKAQRLMLEEQLRL